MKLVIIAIVFLSACAKEKLMHLPDQGLQVSDIPNGCTLIYEGGRPLIELHTFRGVGDARYASVFDCAEREGFHCKYYLYVSNSLGLPLEDYSCE